MGDVLSLEQLDLVASQSELEWGVGMLRLAVGEELRGRFDAQAVKLNAAIEDDDAARIEKHSVAMIRAWRALEGEARTIGIRPPNQSVWVGRHPTAGKVCIYTDSAALSHLPEGVPRFHVEELVKMIPDAVMRIKGNWPESKVTKRREKLDDDIPF
tara:strand:+ start:683 stop:1150 length:468 start_codon:yes stop_codon:yes gene_type:complete